MALIESFGLGMIDKSILDSLKVGDKVKCNDWKDFMVVTGVSENYIVLDSGNGEEYSIIEKKPADHSRGHFHKGNYRLGPTTYIFMPHSTTEPEEVKVILNELESGETGMSEKRSIDLKILTVMRKR